MLIWLEYGLFKLNLNIMVLRGTGPFKRYWMVFFFFSLQGWVTTGPLLSLQESPLSQEAGHEVLIRSRADAGAMLLEFQDHDPKQTSFLYKLQSQVFCYSNRKQDNAILIKDRIQRPRKICTNQLY